MCVVLLVYECATVMIVINSVMVCVGFVCLVMVCALYIFVCV